MAPLFRGLCVLVLLGSVRAMGAQEVNASSASIAPIAEYLMDRTVEIAMARSAAPDSISRDAEVLVLTPKGYESAVKGSNGFVCIVERGWMNVFEDSDFGSTRLLSPMCLNPAAARSHLPVTIKRTELALARPSKAAMRASLLAAFDRNELSLPEEGSMCYMMSKGAYFGDEQGHLFPHVMFFPPLMGAKDWGAGMAGSPLIALPDPDDRWTIVLLPVSRWSDGTPAPAGGDHKH
jgi:hypothetical protein